MAAQSSLYNEDRNLLRIQAKERRNQEAHQEREAFPANVPLFGEPYKINKADELSNRIQKMFGSYEEMKALIATKAHQNFIGIPVMSLIPQQKPDRPPFPVKTSNVLPPSFQNINHHHKHLGPLSSSAPPGNTVHYQKVHSRTEPASQSGGLSSNYRPCQEQSGKTQDVQSSRSQKKNERNIDEDIANELQASLLELSPFMSTLSSPVAPLSPLHSSQHVNSRSHSSNNNKNYGQKSSQVHNLAAGTQDKTLDSSNAPVTAQPSSQMFPPTLPSKPCAIQQKPTAYVRPMDGQDQAPDASPELKPLTEEYHEQSYEKIADLKPNPKTKLSKLKIPAEPIESFSNEVHCVEDILKEMTHSWPPPLTAIHTPSTAEPSKFPFPAKESQHAGSVVQSQKQYDASSKTLSISQQRTSTLQEDLQLSDSEDSDDDQVSDKPSSSSTPPSAPQSQPESVVLAHSSSPESGSTSDSDSSSDSESESSDSDSEVNDPPTRASTPEPDPQTSNRWQLNNWLIKVNQPVSPPENFLEEDHIRSSLQESKGQGKTCSSNSSSSSSSRDSRKSEGSQPTVSHSKSSSKAPRSTQELHLPTKRNYQKSPVHPEEPLDRQVVGSKQPKKSSKPIIQEGQKRGLKVESEPLGCYGAQDQPSKDKPKVKTKGRPKSGDTKELKPAAPEPSERKKHKSSHRTSVKLFSDRDDVKDHVVGSTLEQLPLSPVAQSPRAPIGSKTSGTKPAAAVREDFHRDKFVLPIRDKKLLSPVRDCPVPQGLVVKIQLSLLSRIPQPHGKRSCPRKVEFRESHDMKKQDMDQRSTETSSKPVHKRKQEDVLRHNQKKIKTETKSLSLSGHKDSSKNKISKLSVDTQRKEMPLPPPTASPLQPAQKPAKTAQKRPKSESSACSQPPGPSISTAKSKENHKDASSSKHRKTEGKPSESSNSSKGPAEDTLNPFPVPSLPNGTSKPTKPQSKPHKLHPVEYHLKEAKRLKHKADAMTDKVGKAFKYLDAALSFIECGIAMESDVLSPKPAYTMFAETIDLIKFIMTLKSFTDSSTTTQEKIFIILCMRCQAILYMAMFRYKKDTAIKYSRTLNEHFKSSSRITQAPSPCVARSTGTPSPLSPMPSPAGSVSSQTGSCSSSCGNGSSISVPPHIPTITSSFVNITSYILYAYDLWEQADILARKNKKFFSELGTSAYSLSLNSSMMELVHYIRQGLQWLRMEPNTP